MDLIPLQLQQEVITGVAYTICKSFPTSNPWRGLCHSHTQPRRGQGASVAAAAVRRVAQSQKAGSAHHQLEINSAGALLLSWLVQC
jgi:hypothetical protein